MAAGQVPQQALERLLDLQLEDSAIKRLNHQKATLPEGQRLAELNEQLAELHADIEIAQKQLDEVGREQSRLEDEIELLDAKLERENRRMFSGAVSNPKELSALQAEVEMLKRKRSELEDQLLEVMVQRDQASEALGRLREEEQDVSKERDDLHGVVGEMTGEIDERLAEHRSRREALAPEIPDDVMALYDQLRQSKGGIAVAALEGGTCQGCHTKLPAKEVERVRSEGGLQRCDNCRRILVVR